MKLILLIAMLSAADLVFSQGKYEANWCFGVKAGINFNDTAHPVNFNTFCNAEVSSACISDSLGNLIFYVAPDTPFNIASNFYVMNAIYDNTNKIIPNGDSINVGGDYTEGLVLPVPRQKDNYWLFYEQRIDSFDGVNAYDFGNLAYSKVSKIGNSYMVTDKNQLISSLPIEYKMAGVKHANGSDWWLLLHQSNESISADSTNTFIEYLITKDSILGPYIQDIGSFHNSIYNSYLDNYGQLVFSKDGAWLACSLGDQNVIDVFNFDRCTGLMKNYIPITNIDTTGIGQIAGCAFSSNSTKLYISEGIGNICPRSALYQYVLGSQNMESSKTTIWQTNDSATTFGELSLAPDNKIYLSVVHNALSPYAYNDYNIDNQYLWVIKNPDSAGLACNFQPYGYYLGDSARVYYGLVNMPNYNLGPLAGSPCDTLTGLSEDIRAEKEKIIKIFPNPATDYVVVDYGFTDWNKGEIYLEITNELGQVVYIQQLPKDSGFQKIDVSSYAAGVYMTYIKRQGNIVAVAKFAKQ